MKRLVLVLTLLFAFLVGCGARVSESSQVPPAPTPATPAFDARVTQPTLPLPREQEAIMEKNLTSRLVPYRNDRYGVAFAYPEHLRADTVPGKSLADLANENIEANAKASAGRIVSKDLGMQRLGGEAAWAVQRHWDSSVARYDAVQYFVRKDRFTYSVACGTKQGPPAIPWSAMEPVCQRILATIEFEP